MNDSGKREVDLSQEMDPLFKLQDYINTLKLCIVSFEAKKAKTQIEKEMVLIN